MKTKIFCIGNVLFGDDGIAIEVCKKMKEIISNQEISIIEIGPYIYNIPLYIDDAEKIIIDAVVGFGKEGDTFIIRGLERIMHNIKREKAYSIHSLNIDTILENIFIEEIPISKNDIILIGIEHSPTNKFQLGISSKLKSIIPKVISTICKEVVECK